MLIYRQKHISNLTEKIINLKKKKQTKKHRSLKIGIKRGICNFERNNCSNVVTYFSTNSFGITPYVQAFIFLKFFLQKAFSLLLLLSLFQYNLPFLIIFILTLQVDTLFIVIIIIITSYHFGLTYCTNAQCLINKNSFKKLKTITQQTKK